MTSPYDLFVKQSEQNQLNKVEEFQSFQDAPETEFENKPDKPLDTFRQF